MNRVTLSLHYHDFYLESGNLILISLPQRLDVSLHDDVNEGFEQIKDQPDVDHLDVCRRGQALADADEQGRDDEEHGDVGRDEPLEKELLEVVGHVADDVDYEGGQEGGEDDAQQPSLDRHLVFKIRKDANKKDIEQHLNSHTSFFQLLHHHDFLDCELKQVHFKATYH